MVTKKCFKCNSVLPLTAYYKHGAMADGHLGKCIICTKKDVREREDNKKKDPEWVEKEKIRHREKYYRLGYKDMRKPTKEARKVILTRYYEKFPEKLKAKSVPMSSKKYGYHAHHWSYRKEHFKDVVLLLPKDHYKAHRYSIYDQERRMYRAAKDNILLDTKEKYLEFIESIKHLD